jgi:hypothetical protein
MFALDLFLYKVYDFILLILTAFCVSTFSLSKEKKKTFSFAFNFIITKTR